MVTFLKSPNLRVVQITVIFIGAYFRMIQKTGFDLKSDILPESYIRYSIERKSSYLSHVEIRSAKNRSSLNHAYHKIGVFQKCHYSHDPFIPFFFAKNDVPIIRIVHDAYTLEVGQLSVCLTDVRDEHNVISKAKIS